MNAGAVLSKVIELSNDSVDFDRRLLNLVDYLAAAFSVPLCGLFLWDSRQNILSLKACNRQHPAFPLGLRISAHEGPLGFCARKKSPVVITDAAQLSLWDPPIPESLRFFPFLSFFPVIDDIALYGVLAILGEQPRELSEEESSLLPVICRQLAGTIRGAQISLQAKKRIAELSTLHAIGMAVSSPSDLGELLGRITLSSAKILQADGSILRLLDEDGGLLRVVSTHPAEEKKKLRPLALGEGIAGMVAFKGEPILFTRGEPSSRWDLEGRSEIASLLCVPLVHKAKTIGTLSLFHTSMEDRPEKFFEEEDKNLLSTMASQIAIAIENAIILQRTELLASDKERVVRELSLLYELSRSMLTTINLDHLLRVILISVTFGIRQGFDRAALFLVDEKAAVLEGMLGVGPRDREEAEIWRKKGKEQFSLTTDPLLAADWEDSPYDLRIKQVRIPLTEEHSILIQAIKEKRTFNIENAATNPKVNPQILAWFGSRAFACVPLIAKGKAIGLLAVDNLHEERPITAEDIGFLTLLANQAALALENSRLYRNLQEINTQLLQTQNRLIQSEKLAALGEVVASISHEMKNPLVSIGGFARRLERTVQENSVEKKYLRIVLKEVKRLEDILNETLTLCKEPSAATGRHDLNQIIEETLAILVGELEERTIRVNKLLTPDLPVLLIDPQQMKQVFLNLFVNAMQAISKEGTLTVKTSVQRQEDREVILIEVGDTGGGVPLEILDNIFNPFFTTKQEGTGLGLSIAHKIITQHHGEIEVVNQPGVGATFILRFPLGSF